MSQNTKTRDYDSTLARIAGNIAAGIAECGVLSTHDHDIAERSVELAKLIVLKCRQVAQEDKQP